MSDLVSQLTVLVKPQRVFRLSDSLFDPSAQGTSFAPTCKSDSSCKLTDQNVTPCLGYVPANLLVKLQSAVCNADLKVGFVQSSNLASVKLSGTLQVGKVRVLSAGSSLSVFQMVKSEDFELLSFDLPRRPC